MTVSLQAIFGLTSHRTLCLTGQIKGCFSSLLVASGSTHNFLDDKVDHILQCKPHQSAPFWVTVSNGEKLCSPSAMPNFSWQMKGIQFSAPMHIPPLGCCDAVLGVEWLEFIVLFNLTWKSCGLVSQRMLDLLSQKEISSLQSISVDSLSNLCSTGWTTFLVHLYPIFAEPTQAPSYPHLNHLLHKYEDVFAKPTSLPLCRLPDHKISRIPHH